MVRIHGSQHLQNIIEKISIVVQSIYYMICSRSSMLVQEFKLVGNNSVVRSWTGYSWILTYLKAISINDMIPFTFPYMSDSIRMYNIRLTSCSFGMVVGPLFDTFLRWDICQNIYVTVWRPDERVNSMWQANLYQCCLRNFPWQSSLGSEGESELIIVIIRVLLGKTVGQWRVQCIYRLSSPS